MNNPSYGYNIRREELNF